MSWKFSIASDIGGRKEQQDCIEILSSDVDDSHLVIVADGMGGHKGGALAARTVIETARERFNNDRDPDPQEFLNELCLESHHAISALGGDEERSPGSTCVFLYLNGSEAYWAHVGDSRLYHFQNGELLYRTQDHSVVQLMMERGDIRESDVADSGIQNQLYMCLGGTGVPEPGHDAHAVDEDELFMLCSDGFWSYIEPEEVAECMQQQSFQEGSAEHLVELAKERGGCDGDNISLALISWTPEKAFCVKQLFERLITYLASNVRRDLWSTRLRYPFQSKS
jgi:serine/threonine protein phosphatase PrpC